MGKYMDLLEEVAKQSDVYLTGKRGATNRHEAWFKVGAAASLATVEILEELLEEVKKLNKETKIVAGKEEKKPRGKRGE